MKKMFHVCIASHNEVMFRNPDDFKRATNCWAVALSNQESTSLAHSFMSDHIHFGVRTDNPALLVKRFRDSYNKYFNHKYLRKGALGDKSYFCIELDGVYHTLAAISYILRNCVHHGVCASPFAYPYSSACCYFREELNQGRLPTHKQDFAVRRNYLSKNIAVPSNYCFDSEGIIAQESYTEINYLRSLYGTHRSFLYYMNRLTSDEWQQEQQKDNNNLQIITLPIIEQGGSTSYSEMLANEKGRFNNHRLTDIDLCQIIDTRYVPAFKRQSYCQLTEMEKSKIMQDLKKKQYVADKQLMRCLGGVEGVEDVVKKSGKRVTTFG